MSSYPGSIKTFTNPRSTDPVNLPPHATQHSDLNDEVNAIETELGVDPAGSEDTVVDRLDALDTTVASKYAPGGTDVVVADGGTGVSSLTPYAVLCGGTASTSGIQNIASVGTSGQVLTSNGASSLPTFQALPSNDVANGGTGVSSLTPYGIVCGGTNSTADVQVVAPGTAGYLLVSNGTASLPSFQTASAYATTASVTALMDTSTGHDHDGSDSKKVVYTNLDMTGITDGHYLYNNAGTPAGQALSILGSTYAIGSGAYLLSSADTERLLTDSSYTKKKEIQIPKSGALRISFALRGHDGNPANAGYGRIYRNGSAVGTERSRNESSYQTFTEDITGWTRGDLVQLYAKGLSGNQVGVKEFRIYIDYVEVATVNTD